MQTKVRVPVFTVTTERIGLGNKLRDCYVAGPYFTRADAEHYIETHDGHKALKVSVLIEEHLPACRDATLKAAQEQATYDRAFPYACTACSGWGLQSDDDPSVGIYDAHVPCEKCVTNGTCPRCAQPLWFTKKTVQTVYESDDDYYDECDHCGFRLEETSGRPPLPECGCWLLG